jgi:hypothetical protein
MGEIFSIPESPSSGDDPPSRGLYTAPMTTKSGPDAKTSQIKSIYHIQIRGHISPERTDYFVWQCLASSFVSAGEPTTLLTGEILDQAHLRGLLNMIWDLNFEVIQVRRLDRKLVPGGPSDE